MPGGRENLIPIKSRTTEERRSITTKAGIASGEARREKRSMRERLKEILEMKVPDSELTYAETILQKQMARAMGIDLTPGRAAEWVVENADGKLTETVETKGVVVLNLDDRLKEV